jgi:hypothetical protein
MLDLRPLSGIRRSFRLGDPQNETGELGLARTLASEVILGTKSE